MLKNLKSALRLTALVAASCNTIHAGGLYLTEISAAETSLAGAGWAARAQDPSTAFTNPGGMTQLEGTQIQFTAQALMVNTEFNSDNGGDSSLDNWTPGGSLFITHQVNQDWSVGFSVAGFFGLGLDYDNGWDGRYYVDEINLVSIGFQPTVAYKINDQWSVGVGVALLSTDFEQQLSVNTGPNQPDGKLKLDDTTTSTQINLGIFYEPVASTRFGIQYLSESDVDLETRPKFSGVDGTLIGTALSNNGLLNSKVDLDMTLPQSIMFSAFHQLTDEWAIMGNIGWQEWSAFGKVDIDVNASSSISKDRGYDDTWHFAAGVQYQLTEQWRLNTGIAFDTSMVDDDDVTPDLPTGDSWRYALGGTYAYSETLAFSAGYEIIWFGDTELDVERAIPGSQVSGTYETYAIHFFSLSVNWKL